MLRYVYGKQRLLNVKILLFTSKSIIYPYSASISKVMVDNRNTGIASSYDTTLSIWSLDSLKCESLLSGVHTKPVTEFDWKNSLCVSGDREGTICVWDINKSKCIKSYKGHSGQISKILLYSDGHDSNLIISGGASVLVNNPLGWSTVYS